MTETGYNPVQEGVQSHQVGQIVWACLYPVNPSTVDSYNFYVLISSLQRSKLLRNQSLGRAI
jgi:hypothetical protein